MLGQTNRRAFIAGIGGAAAAPLVSRAQSQRVRRIGFLVGLAADAVSLTNQAAFVQVLQQLGWFEGRNIRIDTRWGNGDANTIRKNTTEVVAPTPDVILAVGGLWGRQ